MKKIFAILISLLFVLGTFGFASAVSESDSSTIDCCDPTNFDIDKTSVKVGETFTVTVQYPCLFCLEGVSFEHPCDIQIVWSTLINGPPEYPFPPGSPIERVGVENLGDGKHIITLRAVSPGTIVFKNEDCSKTVTITSRAIPMDKFMKFFGLGNKNKE